MRLEPHISFGGQCEAAFNYYERDSDGRRKHISRSRRTARERPTGFQILLGFDKPLDAERIFQALAENGTVKMPMQKTFWAARYGALIDQFGVPWEVARSL